MSIKQTFFCGGLVALSTLFSPFASSAPQNGMGVYLGVISASENTVASNGLSLGGDAQFALNNDWSLNPYLMLSAERDANSKTIADGLAGVSLRRWLGEWFVGGQVFEHDRLIIDNSAVQNSAYGLGGGIVAGIEYANGWGAAAQADFEPNYSTNTQRNALRVHLTYRWH